MRLGEASHNVLDWAVSTRLLWAEDWQQHVFARWETELGEQEDRARKEGVLEPARRWSRYQLTRARLGQVANRIRKVILTLPPEAEILTEQPLSARGGRLVGRPDLIVRAPEAHRVIDYKIGSVLDQDTQLPREAYARQLQLYAYLEFEASGNWPTRADLFPFSGSAVAVDVDPMACLALADTAIAALDEYNATAPAQQPASPSPQHCASCAYAGECPAFWDACDVTWADSLLAVLGPVLARSETPIGGVSVNVHPVRGSLAAEEALIRNIDSSEHPAARGLETGVEIGAVALTPEEGRASYRLPPWGLLTSTN